ncbi:hypothetical protein C2759_03670 [Polynucleobacter sp. MG-Unter2-18]|uniref:hypothetical protein n=1 Tax=Polynucleobacter sp. MG-Unter2-18 TaxID=2081052 RepID=UPI001BFD2267|nr:hypothetical protein [Polynucleobacter sp. MG-Unter2-18]QWD95237.1 hypothetical protein C2759_03670 [Polynucleobacter sp. MG-Unter2-18]
MNKLITVIFCISLLFGCANRDTSANQYSARLNTLLSDSMSKGQACFKVVEDTQEAKYVRANIIFNDPDAQNKFELLGSTKKVSVEDKKMLAAFLVNRQPCFNESIKSLKAIYPPFANIQAASLQRSDAIYAKLMSGSIAIGDANQAIQENLSAFRKEWSAETTALNARIQNDHNVEVQDRYSRTMIIQNMLNSYGSPYKSPSMTNCQQIGNSFNCLTQ